MSQPTFTFVLPALNASGSLFERALSSIREQDYPAELVEILVADGGSTDDTRAVAERYGARVIENPNRLAEWGVKEGMLVAQGEVCVVFAADNELVGRDWLARVGERFESDPELAAVFGRLVSGPDDAPLNKYIELIQSEPLNWFLNRNLEAYLDGVLDRGRRLRGVLRRSAATARVGRERPRGPGRNGRGRSGSATATSPTSTPFTRWSSAAATVSRISLARSVTTTRSYGSPTCAASGFETRSSISCIRPRPATWNGCMYRDFAGGRSCGSSTACCPRSRRRTPHGAHGATARSTGLYHPATTFLQAATYAQALLGSGEGRRLLSRSLLRRS